jgi:hypothetical protein
VVSAMDPSDSRFSKPECMTDSCIFNIGSSSTIQDVRDWTLRRTGRLRAKRLDKVVLMEFHNLYIKRDRCERGIYRVYEKSEMHKLFL